MTLPKRELIERFLDGDGSAPDASREQLRTLVRGGAATATEQVLFSTDDPSHDEEPQQYRCIIGYGHAVYAAEVNDGQYALFGDGYASHNTDVGWAGYSGQTTQHLQELKGMFEEHDVPYTVVDYQLSVSEIHSGESLAGIVLAHETKPAPGDGYTNTL